MLKLAVFRISLKTSIISSLSNLSRSSIVTTICLFILPRILLISANWSLIFSVANKREIYLPNGNWRNFANPIQTFKGGKTISFEADLDTLPRFIRENSIYVLGNVYSGNSKRWKEKNKYLDIFVSPASKSGTYAFDYVDEDDNYEKRIQLVKVKKLITLSSPALSTPSNIKIFLEKAPKEASINGKNIELNYNADTAILEILVEVGTAISLKVKI